MYRDTFIPGLVLTALYVLYVILIALFRPQWAPALPAEARTFREPNGTMGGTSLIVLTVTALIVGTVFAKTRPDNTPTDELVVMCIMVGVSVPFLMEIGRAHV